MLCLQGGVDDGRHESTEEGHSAVKSVRGTCLSPKVSSRSCSLPSSWASWVTEWRSLEASW